MKTTFFRSLTLALAMTLCLTLLPIAAAAVDSDFVIESGVLVEYTGPGGDVVIPDGVTAIGEKAFAFAHITSVVIPDSVTVIGDGAFVYTPLTDIVIPDSVTTLGGFVFLESSLKSVVIPDSVTSMGNAMFESCSELKTATIGAGITQINDRMFYECFALTSVTLPSGLTSIGEMAFLTCASLTDITIPEGVTTIGGWAFTNCRKLSDITLPSTLTHLGDYALAGCAMTSLAVPESVTSMGEYIFSGCNRMESVTLPSGLTAIPPGTLTTCRRLKSVAIPEGVTVIGDYAFFGCDGLTSLRIPPSVTTIGSWALMGLSAMESIAVPPTVTTLADVVFHPEIIVYGEVGSAIEKHAQITQYGINFIAIDSATPPTLELPSSWAAQYVTEATAAGLVPDTLQSKFTQATTRAEFCALAVALYQSATNSDLPILTSFNDTTDENVLKMATFGVVNGVGDGNFDPDAKLTREQAAAMLSRLANAMGKPLTAGTSTFTDTGSLSSWAVEPVGQMQATGVMTGVGENTFAPKSDYTREQSIITILRLYNLVK